jgi:hypothetical protein
MSTVIILTGAGNWTVPVDWNDAANTIERIGGGGGGGAAAVSIGVSGASGGGGGGGAYNVDSNVTLSGTVSYSCGAAGAASSGSGGGNGGATTFGSLASAPGGNGGTDAASDVSAGAGGTGGSGTGTGGNGGNGQVSAGLSDGGGGGGAAGPSNGNAGSTPNGGQGDGSAGGAGAGGAGQNGGNGSELGGGAVGAGGGAGGGSGANSAGAAGNYGAGGGGAGAKTVAGTVGTPTPGSAGVIVITYTSAANITQTPASVEAVNQYQSTRVRSGAAVTAGMPVYQSAVINPTWLPATAAGNTIQSGNIACGIALDSAPGANQSFTVWQSGTINLGASLTEGETYVVSPYVAAGNICPIKYLTTNNYVTILGVALDQNNMASPPGGVFPSAAQHS